MKCLRSPSKMGSATLCATVGFSFPRISPQHRSLGFGTKLLDNKALAFQFVQSPPPPPQAGSAPPCAAPHSNLSCNQEKLVCSKPHSLAILHLPGTSPCQLVITAGLLDPTESSRGGKREGKTKSGGWGPGTEFSAQRKPFACCSAICSLPVLFLSGDYFPASG